MKTLRFLLVVTFILTVFVSPAQAKGGEMGFVPLLAQADSSAPLRVQMQQAYEMLLPELLLAQKSGAILEFQPEFGAGVVKIKYATGVHQSNLGGMTVFDNIKDAAVMALHTQPAASQITTLTYNPHFLIYLYDSCPSIYGLGAGDHVLGRLLDKTGQLVAVYDDYADTYGQTYWGCFDGAYTNVLPGYKVTFKVYTSAGVLRSTSFTSGIPNITFTALDKVNSIASGAGPAGKAYYAGWYHRYLNAANAYLYTEKTGTTSGAGAWSADFGTTKFRGGDSLWIDITSNRFTYERYMPVPYAYCYLGEDFCGMGGFPNKPASMTITHAGTPYTFTGKFSPWGWFGDNLEDASGYPVFLVAGDRFVGTGIPVYSLPNLTANINYTTDIVSGKAPANKYFMVYAYQVYSGYSYGIWAHSDASGNYLANFHSMVDLKTTDALNVGIQYYDPASGNRTYLYKPFGP